MEQLKELKQKGERDKESLKKAIRAQKERAEKSEEYAEQLHVQLADKVVASPRRAGDEEGTGVGRWMGKEQLGRWRRKAPERWLGGQMEKWMAVEGVNELGGRLAGWRKRQSGSKQLKGW